MPDDPEIMEMDPVLKLWMFENWLTDQRDQGDLAKNHAYLLGSFFNPEAVRQLTDSANKYESTDEEFEESLKMVKESRERENKSTRKRLKLKRRNG